MSTLVSKSYKYSPATIDAFYKELEDRERAAQRAKRSKERGDMDEYRKAKERADGVSRMRKDAGRLSDLRKRLRAATEEDKERIRRDMITIARKYITESVFPRSRKSLERRRRPSRAR